MIRIANLTGPQHRLVLALIEAAKRPRKEMDPTMVTLAEPEAQSAVRAEVAQVDSFTAARWLGANIGNRHIRPSVVSRYARDMAAGVWELNGETIKIAETGRVLDGQHRLHAVIEAGASVPMFVVTGLPELVQETVDRGLPRNVADALRLRGETNVIVLAGAIAQAIVMRSSKPGSNAEVWPSTRESIAYLESHPDIRESTKRGEILRKAISFPATTAAALHHLFAELDAEDADAFVHSLADGADLADDSPILRLRETMIREMSAPRRMNRLRLQALSIKAWNAWRRGSPVKLLKWKTGGSDPEVFPRPE